MVGLGSRVVYRVTMWLVTPMCFMWQVYRVYSNNQDVEITRLSETLATYSDDSRVSANINVPLLRGIRASFIL